MIYIILYCNKEIRKIIDANGDNNNNFVFRCGCEKCITSSKTDSLRYSMCRVNEYRALASPSLIALSSADPILTAFQLSWELRRLARIEKEFKNEYLVKTFPINEIASAVILYYSISLADEIKQHTKRLFVIAARR